ncbi:MAG TPA: DUF1848 domain-containing protein [Methanolinea sp.]|nr:DUF1848 domain-containing protein [Methanolinea sp.]HQK55790.1 DUF1848 domain-containing protein [Methanolinea sp.]
MGRFAGWEHVEIMDDEGIRRDAIAPVIVSASRSTDIPAFFGEWFIHRLMRGHVAWINPWNRQGVFVSFAHTRVFAFWSKNPRPFMTSLSSIREMGYSYYFLFTLNDYESEGLEPGIPELSERVKTFLELSRMIGPGRVVWRYDPLLLSDSLGVDDLLSRVEKIGFRLKRHTRRLVISFIDIQKYPTVRRTLEKGGFSDVREFSDQDIDLFCSGLADMNAEWGLSLSACGEPRDLSSYGISRGQCISGDLLRDEFRHDQALMQFLGEPENKKVERPRSIPFRHLKDPGQRGACGCIASKDIGQYSTCMHLCRYCYANASAHAVEENARKYQALSHSGVFPESICGNQKGI